LRREAPHIFKGAPINLFCTPRALAVRNLQGRLAYAYDARLQLVHN